MNLNMFVDVHLNAIWRPLNLYILPYNSFRTDT